MTIKKIVSGGQTGADTGGLEAAIWCKVPHGGWCPKGRICEAGVIPSQYNLKEMPTRDYLKRTEANVVDSDATLIFTYGKLRGGSLRTLLFAEQHNKPVLHVGLHDAEPDELRAMVISWLKGELNGPHPPKDCVLNVAGNREAKAPGICRLVTLFMVDIINSVNGMTAYPPHLPDVGAMVIREGNERT